MNPSSRRPASISISAVCFPCAAGITVLTKSDLVDRETLDVVRLEVEEFLRGSFLDPAHSSDRRGQFADRRGSRRAKTGAGTRPPPMFRPGIPPPLARLPIDRVFTMKGFGAVVTGTLVSGTIREEDELEVLPGGQAGAGARNSGAWTARRSKRWPGSAQL